MTIDSELRPAWKKPREELIAKGICVMCGLRPARPNELTCQFCYAQRRASRKDDKAMGICVTCGAIPASPGYVSCEKCREKARLAWHNRNKGERKKKADAAALARKAKRQAKGLCPKCGVRPPSPGYTTCEECRAQEIGYYYANERPKRLDRKNKGICTHCGENPACPGHTVCEICYQKRRDYKAANPEDRKKDNARRLKNRCGGNAIKVLERDNHACQLCRRTEKLQIHHVDGNHDNDDPENLIVLCAHCHGAVTFARIALPKKRELFIKLVFA